MQIQTIPVPYLKTLDWYNDQPIDWNAAGTVYSLNKEPKQLQKYHFGFAFDSSISSDCGTYALLYLKLGTKGILLKNGKILREINRSYYQSDVYEFPAAFFTWNDTVYLAHCPQEYNRIDFEEVESGQIITKSESRKPLDFFHSRLEVSPDNRFLLSKGWFWHPYETIRLFDIEACISNPELLDRGDTLDGRQEICSASFIDNEQILVCANTEVPDMDDEEEQEPEFILPGQLAIWNFRKQEITHAITPPVPVGNVLAINSRYCWDLFDYPKIIDLSTGEIVDKAEHISSGKQNSSIIHYLEEIPKTAYNRNTNQLAIGREKHIEILTPEISFN